MLTQPLVGFPWARHVASELGLTYPLQNEVTQAVDGEVKFGDITGLTSEDGGGRWSTWRDAGRAISHLTNAGR